MSQGKLLTRIVKLTKKIVDLQRRFDLPKEDVERFYTYGGAQELQSARIERSGLQAQLDPIRLIATGVSCRDCLHFADVDRPRCFFNWSTRNANCGWPTSEARRDLLCGPEARWFEPHRLAEVVNA